ncbi:hypothetical protein LIER_38902 [Lithospermum erythrorhizon]|uniref:Uncharacterized protein n=1 Tax=Lithospermum erythrorhizon TaxID=34254 RepID=A0AAV3Q8W7_LITER
MIRKRGWSNKNPTTGLGYASKPPLHILIKRVNNHHVLEVDEEVPINQARKKRHSVFLRLGAISTPKKKKNRKSVFQRLGATIESHNPTQRGSAFDRLGRPTPRPNKEQLEE